MPVVGVDEVALRVTRRLLAAGTSEDVVRQVVRPGFFANGTAGLVEFARRLGVLEPDERVD
ncbi:MAG: hypothetical protein JO257_08215 [Deltaproteobacteria bacterium]|nr:hypothetical protein [Deltaproteobacteria bacterium]